MWNQKLKTCVILTSLAGALLIVPSVVPFERQAIAAASKETENARREIQAAYNQMMSAASRKDARGAVGNRTKDYVFINTDGTRTSGAVLEQRMSAMFQAAESINVSNVIEKITLKGDKATVATRGSGTIIFPASNGRERIVLKITERSSDIWVKRSGKWFTSQSKALSSRMTANGKVVK